MDNIENCILEFQKGSLEESFFCKFDCHLPSTLGTSEFEIIANHDESPPPSTLETKTKDSWFGNSATLLVSATSVVLGLAILLSISATGDEEVQDFHEHVAPFKSLSSVSNMYFWKNQVINMCDDSSTKRSRNVGSVFSTKNLFSNTRDPEPIPMKLPKTKFGKNPSTIINGHLVETLDQSSGLGFEVSWTSLDKPQTKGSGSISYNDYLFSQSGAPNWKFTTTGQYLYGTEKNSTKKIERIFVGKIPGGIQNVLKKKIDFLPIPMNDYNIHSLVPSSDTDHLFVKATKGKTTRIYKVNSEYFAMQKTGLPSHLDITDAIIFDKPGLCVIPTRNSIEVYSLNTGKLKMSHEFRVPGDVFIYPSSYLDTKRHLYMGIKSVGCTALCRMNTKSFKMEYGRSENDNLFNGKEIVKLSKNTSCTVNVFKAPNVQYESDVPNPKILVLYEGAKSKAMVHKKIEKKYLASEEYIGIVSRNPKGDGYSASQESKIIAHLNKNYSVVKGHVFEPEAVEKRL